MLQDAVLRYVDMPMMTYRLTPGGKVLSATAGQGSVRGRHGFNASEDLVDDVYLCRDRTDHDGIIRGSRGWTCRVRSAID